MKNNNIERINREHLQKLVINQEHNQKYPVYQRANGAKYPKEFRNRGIGVDGREKFYPLLSDDNDKHYDGTWRPKSDQAYISIWNSQFKLTYFDPYKMALCNSLQSISNLVYTPKFSITAEVLYKIYTGNIKKRITEESFREMIQALIELNNTFMSIVYPNYKKDFINKKSDKELMIKKCPCVNFSIDIQIDIVAGKVVFKDGIRNATLIFDNEFPLARYSDAMGETRRVNAKLLNTSNLFSDSRLNLSIRNYLIGEILTMSNAGQINKGDNIDNQGENFHLKEEKKNVKKRNRKIALYYPSEVKKEYKIYGKADLKNRGLEPYEECRIKTVWKGLYGILGFKWYKADRNKYSWENMYLGSSGNDWANYRKHYIIPIIRKYLDYLKSDDIKYIIDYVFFTEGDYRKSDCSKPYVTVKIMLSDDAPNEMNLNELSEEQLESYIESMM